ncbi:hypothetical protein BLOT_006170 [Blomia tropicalis]|nr:hypothetical protein BLOT_006170 [Blomia tropicalis]
MYNGNLVLIRYRVASSRFQCRQLSNWTTMKVYFMNYYMTIWHDSQAVIMTQLIMDNNCMNEQTVALLFSFRDHLINLVGKVMHSITIVINFNEL